MPTDLRKATAKKASQTQVAKSVVMKLAMKTKEPQELRVPQVPKEPQEHKLMPTDLRETTGKKASQTQVAKSVLMKLAMKTKELQELRAPQVPNEPLEPVAKSVFRHQWQQ